MVTGVGVAEPLWTVDQLSRVVAFRLIDGSEVVAKARPFEPRLEACIRAQVAAYAAGIPCPQPIGTTVVDGWSVAVEEHRPGGSPRIIEELGTQVFVDLWLRLDDAVGNLVEPGTSDVDDGREQPTPPPWADSMHPGPDAFPARDERLADLRADRTVTWLWDAAERVRRRVAEVDGPLRVGHLDLYTNNLRWRDGDATAPDALLSLDDWDSLGAMPEVILVGQTAGVYTTTREPFTAPTVAQTREFLERWLATSGCQWGREEWQLAWAAGLWTKIFDAQDGVVNGNTQGLLERTRPQIEDGLRLAGA